MSTKEFEQADEQVIAMVNNRSSVPEAEEIPCGNGAEAETEPAERCEENTDLQKEEGGDWISEEKFNQLEALATKARKQKSVICMAVCLVITAVLLLTFSKPELLNWLVSVGVVSCSVVIGMALERLICCKKAVEL